MGKLVAVFKRKPYLIPLLNKLSASADSFTFAWNPTEDFTPPTTSSFVAGFVVPIPTLPDAVIRKRSAAFALNAI